MVRTMPATAISLLRQRIAELRQLPSEELDQRISAPTPLLLQIDPPAETTDAPRRETPTPNRRTAA
jgi:hypothetical protein